MVLRLPVGSGFNGDDSLSQGLAETGIKRNYDVLSIPVIENKRTHLRAEQPLGDLAAGNRLIGGFQHSGELFVFVGGQRQQNPITKPTNILLFRTDYFGCYFCGSRGRVGVKSGFSTGKGQTGEESKNGN